MNKTEYLKLLEEALGNMSREEKQDILYDYEEHFTIGKENGKTEEEIADSLGDPRAIAKQFKAEYAVKQAETTPSTGNVFRAVFAAIGLGFFNLVFILGPFLGVVGVMIGLFAMAVSITVAGLAVLLALVVSPLFPGFVTIELNPGVLFFGGVGLAALGMLELLGLVKLTGLILKGTAFYLKKNISIIIGRRNSNV